MPKLRLTRKNLFAHSGWAAFLALLLVSPLGQQRSWSTGQDVQPRRQPAADASAQDHRRRYLQAYLKLMEISLQRDKRINKKARGTIPAGLLAERRRRVETARKMLQAASEEQEAGGFRVYLYLAEAAAQAADAEFRRWTAVRERAPTALSALDLEHFQLRAKLAQITWEEGAALIDAPAEQQQDWKINSIFDELVRLTDKVERSTLQNSYRTRYVYPFR